MAVRNGLPYLHETLRSVAEQSYGNFELDVWDNGSTDGTIELLREWIPNRIAGRIIDEAPLALGESRAALVINARNELCAYLDADDILVPQRLALGVAAMRSSPSLVAVGGQVDIIDQFGTPMDARWYHPLDDAEIRWRTHWKCCFCASTMLFRKSAALAAGNFRDRPRGIDQDLWLRLARIGPLANLPNRLAFYRQHDRNLTASFENFLATERGIASANADSLFAGESPVSAMALWDDLYPSDHHHSVRPLRIGDLHRTAISAARRIGERDDFFTTTSFFQHQRKYLWRNITRTVLGLDVATFERLDRLRSRFRLSGNMQLPLRSKPSSGGDPSLRKQ